MSSFYPNCDCSELLLGPRETSHGHREPHKAARCLLWVRARTLCGRSQCALGVRGICLHLMSWGIVTAIIAGSCWRSSELHPRGLHPPHAACSPGWEDWGPAGSPPAVPQVGERPRISAGDTSGCNLGEGSYRYRQATCRASPWSHYTAVYLGGVCTGTQEPPYTPRLAQLFCIKHNTSLFLNKFACALRAGLKAILSLPPPGPPRRQTVGWAAMGILVGRFGYRF